MQYLEKRWVRLAVNAFVFVGMLIALILVVGNGEIFPSSVSLPAALGVLFSFAYIYVSFDVLQPYYANRTFLTIQQVLFFLFTAIIYGLGLAQAGVSFAAETMQFSPWAISLPDALAFGSMLAIFLMQLFSNGKRAKNEFITRFFFLIPVLSLFVCYLLFSLLSYVTSVPILEMVVGIVIAVVSLVGTVFFNAPYKKIFPFYKSLYEKRVKEAQIQKEYEKEKKLAAKKAEAEEGEIASEENRRPVLTVEEFFDLVNRAFEFMGKPFSYLSLEDPGNNAFLNSRRKDGEYCLTVDLRFYPTEREEGIYSVLAAKKSASEAEADWFREKLGEVDLEALFDGVEGEGKEAAKKRIEKVVFGLWDSVSVFASYTLNPAPSVYETGPYKAIKFLKIGMYYGF